MHCSDGLIFLLKQIVLMVRFQEWQPISYFVGLLSFVPYFLDVDLLKPYFFNLLLNHLINLYKSIPPI